LQYNGLKIKAGGMEWRELIVRTDSERTKRNGWVANQKEGRNRNDSD